MSSKEWTSVDNYKESYITYNCAFLDILGYKERVAAYFNGEYNLFGRIDRALTTTQTCMAITAPFLNTDGLQVEIVSDSIVMTQPASDSQLGSLLLFTCLFSSSLSFEELFVRGGIARGKHCRRQTSQGFDFLASEALQKAYLQESQLAVFPRTLVDPEIINSLSLDEKRLLVTENGKFFVDFANHVINREGTNLLDVESEMSELSQRMNATIKESVKAKYQWLLDYYCWTIKTNPRWTYSKFEHYASDDVDRFKRINC